MAPSDLIQPRTARGLSRSGAATRVRLQALLAGVFLALGVVGLWLLNHPYQGILHDSRLYVGQVLAAADPGGIGQDIMFAKDGQFGFTVFPALLKVTIDTFGFSQGAELVSLIGLLGWIGALASLAAAMAEGRVRWVIVLFVVLMPTGYGAFSVFHYAEPFAAPRIFAEAFVLLAFALMCQGRKFWALLPLVAGGLLHPIMALPGFGVWVWFVFFDPRERVFPLSVGLVGVSVGAALVLLAAALHVPLAERLFVGIDPAFRDVLSLRARDLFPAFWPLSDWSRLSVQAATLAIAAATESGRTRALFVGALVVGLGGVAAAYLLGDLFNSLLALQVQLWRSVWIVAVLSAAGLAICAVELWRQGGRARLTLGLLILAWLAENHPAVGMPAAIAASVFAFVSPLDRLKFQTQLVLGLWSIVVVFAVLRFGTNLYALMLFLRDRPQGGEHVLQLLGAFGLWTIPVCTLAVIWALVRRSGLVPVSTAAFLAATFVALAVTYWDARTVRAVAADGAAGDPALKALLASRKGEVLWLDGRFETWSFADRPNWVSAMQGASAVFSRDLAMEWDRRAQVLIKLGLSEPRLRDVFENRPDSASAHLTHLSDERLDRLCALDDAPAWLIAPAWVLADSEILPERWAPSHWQAPGENYTFEWDGTKVKWTATQDYVVLRCAR